MSQCLTERKAARGRELRLHVAGHVREAFLVDYLRQRLVANTDEQGCQLVKTPAAPKNFDVDNVPYYAVKVPKGSESCEASYSRAGIKLVSVRWVAGPRGEWLWLGEICDVRRE